MRALGHLVILAGHLHFLAALQIKQREINGATAIMSRTLLGIGDEDLLVFRRCIPEDFRYLPRPISVVNNQTITLLPQRLIHAHQRVGSRTLHECARLLVNRPSQKVVLRRITNIELDRWIEFNELNQVGRTKWTSFLWRLLRLSSERQQEAEQKQRGSSNNSFHITHNCHLSFRGGRCPPIQE